MDQADTSDLKVVLVDDSDLVRQRLHALLKGTPGVSVVGHASSASTGYTIIESTRPQVVVLDIMMPDESGLDLLERLSALDDPPVVVVLTNYPYSVFRKRAMELGAAHFFAKSSEFTRIPEVLQAMAKAGPDA